MDIFELIIDEDDEGVNAISLVDKPAIEENFIALSKDVPYEFQEVSKGIVTGPALIPNKHIFRKDEEGNEFYVYFSEETVERAVMLFYQNSNQNNSTLQHLKKAEGVSTFESWIITDPQNDKAKALGFNLPKGTWMISQKISNPEVLKKVKDKTYRGFSIEGYFADKFALDKEAELIKQLKKILNEQ